MTKRPLLWSASLVLAATLASAAARADDKEVTLTRSYKAGDVERAKVVISFSAGGAEGIIEETARTTVKEVKKNGDVVLVGTVEKGRMTIGGQAQVLAEAPPTTETRSRLNRLLELKADLGPENPFTPEVMKLMSATSDVLFPEKPVKVGGNWIVEFDSPVTKGAKVAVKHTLVAIEKLDDVECWKVNQTAEIEVVAGQPKMLVDMTYWLRPTDGHAVKAEGTSKNVPAQFGAMSWKLKITLVKPATTTVEPAKP